MTHQRHSIRELSKFALKVAQFGGEEDTPQGQQIDRELEGMTTEELVDVIFALAGQVQAMMLVSLGDEPEAIAACYAEWAANMDHVLAPDDPEFN